MYYCLLFRLKYQRVFYTWRQTLDAASVIYMLPQNKHLFHLMKIIVTIISYFLIQCLASDLTKEELQNISVAAQFAGTTYCDSIFATQTFDCGIPCNGVANNTLLGVARIDPKTTARGMVVYNKSLNTIFVSVRGTITFEEALQDLKAWLSKPDFGLKFCKSLFLARFWRPKMMIHAGIEEVYMNLREHLLPKTIEFAKKYEDAKIVFTGHSLGAAVVTLAAIDTHDKYGMADRISVYSFGQPRIGNRAWAEYVDKVDFVSRIYRIRRIGDPVGHLPFKSAFNGYRHSLNPYLILEDDSIIKCNALHGTGEDAECLNDWHKLNYLTHYRSNGYWNMGAGC
jgi:hypothetical protein